MAPSHAGYIRILPRSGGDCGQRQAVTARAQALEVLARDHAAIANKHNTLEPETTLEIANDTRHCRCITPIACKYMMGNRPTIDEHKPNQYLRVTGLLVAAVAMRR